jgi:glycosyltransferase involved in cell wall biosynthesis
MHWLPENVPQCTAWLIALAWTTRVVGAMRGLPTIPNLLLPAHDLEPRRAPKITVIVPARNEQTAIGECLRSLLAQDYAHLKIVAVDDRSTDDTGTIMDSLASGQLTVIHVEELPDLWLGKTHAMAIAAQRAIEQDAPDYLLFTDADVIFRSDAVRRALANAVAIGADHFVLAPTTIIRRWDEAAILSFFQIFGVWSARPWKVADPKAKRDAIGIGAFNMVRTSAYLQVGGFEALRMEIVEDLGFARRIKRAGLAQRFAFGRGLVNVHWAAGAGGIVNVMTKNIFAAVAFHVPLLLLGCSWLFAFCLMPFLLVWRTEFILPAGIVITAILFSYRLMGSRSGLSAWNALLAPFAAAVFIYALLRSMVATLWQGGVVWRGTFYPLAELRKYAAPLL